MEAASEGAAERLLMAVADRQGDQVDRVPSGAQQTVRRFEPQVLHIVPQAQADVAPEAHRDVVVKETTSSFDGVYVQIGIEEVLVDVEQSSCHLRR